MVARPEQSIRRRGFVLVDVIVATIILGVSLVVMLSLAARALGSQQRGEDMATAAHLADEQLHLVLARGPDGYSKRFPTSGVCDPPFNRYRFGLDFSGGGSTGETYRVAATITWATGPIPQSLTIETLIASRDAGEGGDSDPVRTPEQPVIRTP